MKEYNISSHDGIKLTYYLSGGHQENVVFVNAPGHSIKYWVPLIQCMKRSYNLIGMEYRGFPGNESFELSDDQCTLDHYIKDMELILKDAIGSQKFHFIVWCTAAKVGFEYYRRNSHAVKSISVLNIDFMNGRESQLLKVIDALRKHLDGQPDMIDSIMSLVKNIGKVPNSNLINTISEEEEDSPVLDFYDIVSEESNFSSISFYHINTPVGLKNFLKVADSLRNEDSTNIIETVAVPTLILYGSKDSFTPLQQDHIDLFDKNDRVSYLTVEGGSHYMGMELPEKLMEIMSAHIQSACAAATAEPQSYQAVAQDLKKKVADTIERFPWYEKLLPKKVSSVSDLPLMTADLLETHYYDSLQDSRCLVFQTSGTTSNKRKKVFYSEQDNELYLCEKARMFKQILKDPVQKAVTDVGTGHAANTAAKVFEKMGIPSVSIDITSPIEKHIEILAEQRPELLYTMPSILDTIIDNSADPRVYGIKKILLVGEIATEAWMKRVAAVLDIKAQDIIDTYGSIEIGIVAHYSHEYERYLISDSLYAETVPVAEVTAGSDDGENGQVLVLTSAIRQMLPANRFVTYDVVRDFRPVIVDGVERQSFKAIVRRVGSEYKHGEKISMYDIENVCFKYLPHAMIRAEIDHNSLTIKVKSDAIPEGVISAIEGEIQTAIPEIGTMINSGLLSRIQVKAVREDHAFGEQNSIKRRVLYT